MIMGPEGTIRNRLQNLVEGQGGYYRQDMTMCPDCGMHYRYHITVGLPEDRSWSSPHGDYSGLSIRQGCHEDTIDYLQTMYDLVNCPVVDDVVLENA